MPPDVTFDGGGALGEFTVTWSITKSATTAACAQVGADYLSLLSVPVTGQPFDDIFDCADMIGTTFPLAANDYNETARLMSRNGTFSDFSDDVQVGDLIVYPTTISLPADTIVNIGPAEFSF